VNLELDHVFIIVQPQGKVADLLTALGIAESFGRDHQGQGTSNRRFVFSNAMLEFLWVRDSQEAIHGPGNGLQFTERAADNTCSPFGIILNRKDKITEEMPFPGWSYQPDYFEAPMAFHVGINAEKLHEPLCIYLPFMEPKARNVEAGVFRSISHIKIHTTTTELSDVLTVSDKADRLSIVYGDQHLMEITFDEHQSSSFKDFRPDLPLIIYW